MTSEPVAQSRGKGKSTFKIGGRNAVLAACSVLMLILVLAAATLTSRGTDQEVAEAETTETKAEIEETIVPETESPPDAVTIEEFPPATNLPEEIAVEEPKPRFTLPSDFEAVATGGVDPKTQLPLRIRSKKLSGSHAAEFSLVPTGLYTIGVSQPRRLQWERKEGEFANPKPFYFALTETSVEQYEQFAIELGKEVAGENWLVPVTSWVTTTNGDGDPKHLPVTMVSLDSAKQYAQWLGASLPSEDQWEAGAAVVGAAESPAVRTFTGQDLLPVAVNAADYVSRTGGIHVLGNVAEWIAGSQPIVRGAGYATPHGEHVRVGWRSKADPNGQWDVGIRLIVNVIDNENENENDQQPDDWADTFVVNGERTTLTSYAFR